VSFDFETCPERRGTDSQKWQRYGDRDVLPMWVADMDFLSPPAVLEALRRRVDHGIFGYARPVRSTIDAVVGALDQRYGWRIDPAWIVWLPGLVCGLNVAIEAFSDPGDEILSFVPVYPPFLTSPPARGRVSVPVPLALSRAGRWEIDWEALERAASPRSKVLLFCHPHNPIARVWLPEEVARLSEFCARRGIVLCSDEIHCDLILDPARGHTPTATVAPSGSGSPPLVTLMAPSKTYNIPGLGTSFAVIPDAKLRTRLVRASRGIVAEVNALGYAACEAAYRDGEPWRLELLAALRANRDHLLSELPRSLPGIRVVAPIEATYLAWLDVGALGLDDPVGHFEAHGVGLSEGADFGVRRGSAVRLNFGCPRATLEEALRRIRSALGAIAKRTPAA
jgi:cystathionine beta-lyase